MLGSRLTQQAERASLRYKGVLAGFDLVFQRAAANPAPGSPRTLSRAAAEAYTLGDGFLADERDVLSETILAEAQAAIDATRGLLGAAPSQAMPDEILAYALSSSSELDTALRVQLERDVAGILRGLRGVALRGALLRSGGAYTPLESQEIARAQMTPHYAFPDRAGRRWPSANYVRTLWRHALVLTWNEAALLTMGAHGITTAEIQHPDLAHEWAGERITLDEQAHLPSWQDVRETVFHPNSDAWLQPIPAK